MVKKAQSSCVLRCLEATTPVEKCRCRCGGKHHGEAHRKADAAEEKKEEEQ